MTVEASKARLVVQNVTDKQTHPRTKQQTELLLMIVAQRTRMTPQQVFERIKALQGEGNDF